MTDEKLREIFRSLPVSFGGETDVVKMAELVAGEFNRRRESDIPAAVDGATTQRGIAEVLHGLGHNMPGVTLREQLTFRALEYIVRNTPAVGDA